MHHSRLGPSRPAAPLFRSALLCLAALLCFAPAARADALAVWNFNDSNLAADYGAGTLTTNLIAANVGFSTPGSSVNARMGDPAGLSLALQNGTGGANNGASLTLNVSTAGFSNINVSFATQRTSTGFSSNQFQYSLDGVTFVDFGPAFTPPATFALVSFDLSSVTGLNHNPLAAFRIIFNGGSTTSSSGNNRIDNLVVEGDGASATPVPEPATLSLFGAGLYGLATFGRHRRHKSIGVGAARG